MNLFPGNEQLSPTLQAAPIVQVFAESVTVGSGGAAPDGYLRGPWRQYHSIVQAHLVPPLRILVIDLYTVGLSDAESESHPCGRRRLLFDWNGATYAEAVRLAVRLATDWHRHTRPILERTAAVHALGADDDPPDSGA